MLPATRVGCVVVMKGRLGDLLRTVWAWWYWNIRKTLFVARGRVGHCPCHNESDFGSPEGTRCEAVIFWTEPRRFASRVCPLLKKNARGDWVCSVSPAQVRPFWGRVVVSHATALVALVALSGGLAWGGMRAVGYRVTLRQIFWPRAWSELRQVRADLFREKAEAALAAGKPREAIAALMMARQLHPSDYASGMLLAQLLHVAQPEAADAVYRQLLMQHPEREQETAKTWCRSMLARGQMVGVAQLALLQLTTEPRQSEAAWQHALLTAVRWRQDWALLAKAAQEPKLSAETRALLELELRLRRANAAGARSILLAQGPPVSPYGMLHRIERLIEFGETLEASALLREARRTLAGRDLARLTLAAHAVERSRGALAREVEVLLDPRRSDVAAGVAIVAQHLINYPDEELLVRCHAAFERLPEGADRGDAAAALFCAAALAGQSDWLPDIRKRFSGEGSASLVAQQKIEEKLRGKGWSPLFLLSVVRPVSTELNYAVLERIISANAVNAAAK